MSTKNLFGCKKKKKCAHKFETINDGQLLFRTHDSRTIFNLNLTKRVLNEL